MTPKPLTLNAWILHTTIGWILGIALYYLLTQLWQQFGLNLHNGQALFGIGLSAGVGIMQWQLIRQSADHGFKWFWCLFIGLSLPFVLVDLVSLAVGLNPEALTLDVQILGLLCTTIIGASLAGYFQYRFVLGKSELASNWITYHSLAWIAGFIPIAVYLAADQLGLTPAMAAVALLMGGPLLGILTGRRIERILGTPKETY